MKTFLVILFISCSQISVAQKDPFKFGKIDVSDITIDSCDFYPEAHSMILGMYGNLRFFYDNNNGNFKFIMDVIVRKKIFNKTDLDAGTFKIRYYEPENLNSKEEISGLKAMTYNVVDGKIKETKATKTDQFDKRLNDYWKEITVTMPEVQEGSVIEYTYTITSPYLATLKTWYFQADIPVKYSEFRVLLPQFYNYQLNNVGSVTPIEVEEMIRTENFSYSYKVAHTSLVGAPTSTERSSITSNSKYKRFIAKDVAPVIEEPFMNNKVDLPNRIEFQLISIQYPQQPLESVAENYDKFNNEMLSSDNFGGRLDKGNFAKELIASLEGKDEIEKAASVYEWLRKHFSWNGYNGFTSQKAGRIAFNDAKGDAGDINLTLVSALREAGLDAHPVLLSTRGHGIIHPVYPSYDDFNYVVALIKNGDRYIMADATSNMPFGMLPERCLNGQGWVAVKDGGYWVNMKGTGVHDVLTYIQTSFNEGSMTSNITIKEEGYAAADRYEEWKKDGEQKYIEKLQGALAEWEFDNYKTETNSITEGLKYTFTINKDFNGEEIIYLNPLPYGGLNENPFKREQRKSSIDIPYQKVQRVINQIQLPEGYIAEIPKATIIRLPDNAGKFVYNVTQVGNMLSITSDFSLSKTDFTSLDYAGLKQFFQLIADKNQTLIVIKKI